MRQRQKSDGPGVLAPGPSASDQRTSVYADFHPNQRVRLQAPALASPVPIRSSVLGSGTGVGTTAARGALKFEIVTKAGPKLQSVQSSRNPNTSGNDTAKASLPLCDMPPLSSDN
jgi:hypothetical protein